MRPALAEPTTPEQAQPEDLALVLSLLISANSPTEGITDAFPNAYVVVREGRAVIAVAGLEQHGDVGLLRSVATDEQHRGRGIGRVLVENRISALGQSGCTAWCS